MSGFYGKDVERREDRWVEYRCYWSVDIVMKWDGVIGNTVITVTLAL